MTLLEKKSIAILIPALNEVGTISAVIDRASKLGVPIVINDGSTDGTENAAHEAGAHVITLPINKGYEFALTKGMQYAVDHGFSYALTMDADGQHGSDSAKIVLQAMLPCTDIVIGLREEKQRIGETVAGWIGSMLWSINDPFSGLKLYRLSSCAAIGDFDHYRLVGAEMFVRACKRRLKVVSVNIQTAKRVDKSRYDATFSANLKLSRALFFLIFIYLGLIS